MKTVFKIGTRGSKLALAQSGLIRKGILSHYPNSHVELIEIKTTGDKILDSPLSKIGGKGLFVKEIEEALLRKEVDLAVHSMKDLPAQLPDGLTLCAFPEREDPRDALISGNGLPLDAMPHKSRIGTSSLRRGAQLLRWRPDLELVPLRGNVDTRLRKLESGNVEGIILAAAGLRRLGLEGRIHQLIPVDRVLPAIGQGSLGLEVRRDDLETTLALGFLNHEPTRIAIEAERAFLAELQGGCQVPIAGLARIEGMRVVLKGLVADPRGITCITDVISGHSHEAGKLGRDLAQKMLAAGADQILLELQRL